MTALSQDQRGFTIVEVLLATSIAAIVATVMFVISLHFFGSTMQAQVTADMSLESQIILTQLVEDIRLADGIRATNTLADANAPASGWVTNDPSNIIIIDAPATDSDRNIIYNPDTGDPHANEIIYFSAGTTMYKRIFRNPDATGNTAVTSCPPASANTSCPSDREFSSHLENLTFTFYDVDNAPTSDPALARSVNLTVNLSRQAFGREIRLSNSTRTTLRNY